MLAKHPTQKPNPDRQIRNITIPHTKGGMYEDTGLRKDVIKEISAFGFTQEEVIKAIGK